MNSNRQGYRVAVYRKLNKIHNSPLALAAVQKRLTLFEHTLDEATFNEYLWHTSGACARLTDVCVCVRAFSVRRQNVCVSGVAATP